MSGTSDEGSTGKPGLTEDALINAVNEGAEQSIAWFTSLLGISFGGGSAKNATSVGASAAPTDTPSTHSQRGRNFNDIPLK